MEQDLYDRQQRLPGWEQERLTNGSVAILGSDWLAGCCALYLACLGVGRIYLLDATIAMPGERFFFSLAPDQARAQGWADWLKGLGFPNRIIARRIDPALSPSLMPPVDVILSAVNDPAIQEATMRLATARSLPFIIGAALDRAGAYRVQAPDAARDAFAPLTGEAVSQGALPGLTLAALMVEEARRFLAPLPGDCLLPAGVTLHFNSAHPARFFSAKGYAPVTETASITFPEMQRRILLVGAGALGTFAGLGLAMQNGISHITIVDPDYIEPSNGNRQPFYLNKNGEGKSVILSNSLNRINGNIRWNHFAAGVCSSHFDLCCPDLVLSCTDSFVSRHLVHQECVNRRIPLISGGTNAFSGNLAAYVPEKTACLDCMFGLSELAEREKREGADPARCQQAPEPSIVTTNALIGSLMALEAAQLETPLHNVVYYNAGLFERFRWGYVRRPCECVYRSNER